MGREIGSTRVESNARRADRERTILASALSRIFISQALLDAWMGRGTVQLDGDIIRVDASETPIDLHITPAVSFEAVDGEGMDVYQVIGRVKSIAELLQMGGEHFDTSVVIGDIAYIVKPGFLTLPLASNGAPVVLDAQSWSALTHVLSQI